MNAHRTLQTIAVIFLAIVLPATSLASPIVSIRGAKGQLNLKGKQGGEVRTQILKAVEQRVGSLQPGQKLVFTVKAEGLSYSVSPGFTSGSLSLVDTATRKVTKIGQLSFVKMGIGAAEQITITPTARVARPQTTSTRNVDLNTLQVRGLKPAQITAIRDAIVAALPWYSINPTATIGQDNVTVKATADGGRELTIKVAGYNANVTYVAKAAKGKPFDLQHASVTRPESSGPMAFGVGAFSFGLPNQ
jgi:hypothetical protein